MNVLKLLFFLNGLPYLWVTHTNSVYEMRHTPHGSPLGTFVWVILFLFRGPLNKLLFAYSSSSNFEWDIIRQVV